jgi:hypothetical protein
MAKGDYPSELDIPLPFSLVSNDVSKDELVIMPAYWFLHNMYALARNAWKYGDRDKRLEKIQSLEYDYLAPDSVQEIAAGMEKLQIIAARSWVRHQNQSTISRDNLNVSHNIFTDEEALKKLGKSLLEENDPILHSMHFLAEGFENSTRRVRINKLVKAYGIYRELVLHYAVEQMVKKIQHSRFVSLSAFLEFLPEIKKPESWINAGGQLVKKRALDKLIEDIHESRVSSWNEIHQFYTHEAANYNDDKLFHALDMLWQVHGISVKTITMTEFTRLLHQSVSTAEWISLGILSSRKKDYLNPFRRMVYENQSEMDQVVGKLDENSFIKSQEKAFENYKYFVLNLIETWKA